MLDIEAFVENEFDTIENYGSPVTDLVVHCPFCDGSKPHLSISIVKQVCHCWKCDYSNNWIGLVMDVTGKDYTTALTTLYQPPTPVKFDEALAKFIKQREVKLENSVVSEVHCDYIFPDDFQALADYTNLQYMQMSKLNVLRRAAAYLLERNITREHWEYYCLGVSKSVGQRVYIPIEGSFYQARSLYKMQKPKYMSPKMEAKDLLFNSRALGLYGEIVVCEGAFSAISIGPNAIATLGMSSGRDARIERLVSSNAQKFIIAFDAGTLKQSMYYADKISKEGKEVEIWNYRDGDPNDNPKNYVPYRYNFRNRVRLAIGAI